MKEIVQNADDAKAQNLIEKLPDGKPSALHCRTGSLGTLAQVGKIATILHYATTEEL
ncbi:hypothetical protein AB4427_11730 [Vibrio artabrorum]|uniref:hypothetical protein n=1 Tax=Vibrio artabrorum TaxID=446374 RepID=UPI003550B578